MSLRIGLLGNSALVFPAADALQRCGRLAALGHPDLAHEANQRLQELARMWGLAHGIVREASIGADLENWIRDARLDAVLVLTFPYGIPQRVLDGPALGVFNLHASALPRFRGPDPLFWQLRDGVQTSAICAHRMTAGLDDGPIALQIPLVLTADDTHGVAHFRAGFVAGEAVLKLADLLEKHGAALPLTEQDEALATTSSRPEMDHLVIDWAGRSADEVCALVRACNPSYGGAISFFRGVPVRIYEATPEPTATGAAPGQVLCVDPVLRVACREGAIRLDVLHTDDGVFSGPRFARLFEMAAGETLTSTPS